jgi:hypothetical protein
MDAVETDTFASFAIVLKLVRIELFDQACLEPCKE